MGQTESYILPARRTRGLGRLEGIVGSFPRFARSLCTDVPTSSGKIGRGLLSRFFLREGDVCAQANLYVANLNQFRSAFVRAPNFYFVNQFCEIFL